MKEEGDFHEAAWQYADSVNDDGFVPGGGSVTVEESYVRTFGCTGMEGRNP